MQQLFLRVYCMLLLIRMIGEQLRSVSASTYRYGYVAMCAFVVAGQEQCKYSRSTVQVLICSNIFGHECFCCCWLGSLQKEGQSLLCNNRCGYECFCCCWLGSLQMGAQQRSSSPRRALAASRTVQYSRGSFSFSLKINKRSFITLSIVWLQNSQFMSGNKYIAYRYTLVNDQFRTSSTKNVKSKENIGSLYTVYTVQLLEPRECTVTFSFVLNIKYPTTTTRVAQEFAIQLYFC